MTIEEAIDLWNTYSRIISHKNFIAGENLSMLEIDENRKKALEELQSKSKEELLNFIIHKMCNSDYYPILR